MRILITTLPVGAHLQALVPVAHAARRRGHEVAICVADTFKERVAAEHLPHLPAGQDWIGDLLTGYEQAATIPQAEMDDLIANLMSEGFPGPAALEKARDLIAHAEAWQPDLIVRDGSDLAGVLAADALGIPQASVGAVAGHADFLHPAVLATLDRQRSALGLDGDPDGRRVYPHLHANPMPLRYDPREGRITTARSYQLTTERPGQQLPAWVADLDDDRPLVLVGFGTQIPRYRAFEPQLRAVIDGAGALDASVIVTLGRGADPTAYGPQPANVRLVDHIAQPLLLELSDLLVCHAGFTSVRESLRAGVPMVLVPLIVDNFAVADRCERLGVAARLDADTLTPAAVHDACAATLDDALPI